MFAYLPAPIFMHASPTRSSSNAPTVINRAARHRYHVLSTFECGVQLLGTEIKSIRAGRINLRDGFVRAQSGQLFLHNVHISPYTTTSNYFNHDPLRVRRLLLHKADIRRLQSRVSERGLTLVPTRGYFVGRGWFKIEVALARGKQLHDKRETLRQRDLQKEMQRVIKNTRA